MIAPIPLAADARASAALARDTFDRLAASQSVVSHDVRFAGRVLRLRIAEPLAPHIHVAAFMPECARDAPDRAPDLTPDLTIDLWDARSAPLTAPEPGRTAPLVVGRNSAVADTCRVTWEPPCIWGFDLATRRGYFHLEDPSQRGTLSPSQPLLRMLHEWTRAIGLRIVHGAAVALGSDAGCRGLLLTAPGGSGKSTLALAAHLAGWDYAGDDYIAIAPSESAAHPFVAFGTYAIAKLVPAHMIERLPAMLAQRVGAGDHDKALLRVPFVARGLPLAALVVPHVAPDGVTRLAPLSPGRALTALAPSTLFQLPGAGPADLAPLAQLVRALPTWSLAVGEVAEGLAALATLAHGLARGAVPEPDKGSSP